MQMTPQEKRMVRARAGLIMSAPFYAVLALSMGMQERDDIKTMATDGKSLFYSPAFVDKLSDAEIRGVIVHECLHVAFLHHTRRGKRDPELWNIAADYAINLEVAAQGHVLPDGCLMDTKYAGMSAEQIYASFPPDNKKTGKSAAQAADPDGGQIGDVIDAAPDHDPAARDLAEMDAKATVLQAANAQKASGKDGDLSERLAGAIRAPSIDWRVVLRRFVDESARRTTSWSRPNRRFIAQGIYLPGSVADGLHKLAIIIDVSGSIDADALAQFVAEIDAACSDAQPDLVEVIQCHTKITAREEFAQGEEIKVSIVGTGGTDMTPALKEVTDASACIVFTDLEFGSDPYDPGVPVLWAQWGNGDYAISPSFGETIQIGAA